MLYKEYIDKLYTLYILHSITFYGKFFLIHNIMFQGNIWNDSEKALLSVHLAVGVGYYHHLILRLQIEYDLDLAGVVDFAFIQNESVSSYVSKHMKRVSICTNFFLIWQYY